MAVLARTLTQATKGTHMNSNGNINSLFASASSSGVITPEAAQVLAIPDLGAQMQAGLGVGAANVLATEVVLVSVLLDDSGSIRARGNEDAVRMGANAVRDALKESKQAAAILMLIRYLNGTILYQYGEIARVPTLDTGNFNANGVTPLYDQTVVLLGSVIAKKAEFADNGVPCRTATLIVTDGRDEHSVSCRNAPYKVKAVIDSLSSETDIVAAMGIDDGVTPFRSIFRDMGIQDKWILTPKSSPSEIRKAFNAFSQSAVRFSQAAPAAVASVVGGGFAP